MRHVNLTGALLLSVASALAACKGEKSEPEAAEQKAAEPAKPPTAAELRPKAKAFFAVLPARMESDKYKLTDAKIQLGHDLYFDTRLSRGQELSCNSCHDLKGYGVDTRPEAIAKGKSFGHRKQFGERNSPSTYNAALHISQFWDGRAADVEEQAKGPILNPVEMTMGSAEDVVKVLKSIPGYEPLFKAAFPDAPDPITYDTMAQAIGAYERTLTTPSRFDKFLSGDDSALNELELEGLQTFIDTGCIACHQGVGVGGGMYQKLGLIKPYPVKDEGRGKITGNAAEKFFFKVPSLRNVEKTAPYFHDGSIKTLPEAVKIMAEHQTTAGVLPDDKVNKIVAFLGSLTGELPKDRINVPDMPPNGPHTPAPDPNWEAPPEKPAAK